MRKIPESMKAELQSWNNGQGIDLESWTACSGNFSLAVGYASFFCPEFVEIDGYIVEQDLESTTEEIRNRIAGFESQDGATHESVERVINHFHITDIQHIGCKDASVDKIVYLGEILKEIYQS